MRAPMLAAWLCLLLSLSLVVLPASSGGGAREPPPCIRPHIEPPPPPAAIPGTVSAAFIENAGQADAGVLFYASSGAAAFTSSSVMLYTAEPVQGGTASPDSFPPASGKLKRNALEISFVGANDVVPMGAGRLPGATNFFFGNDQSAWLTGVASYESVIYRDVWDGIDLVYGMRGGSLKYDIIVRPGADHARVKLKVAGQESMRPDGFGGLRIRTGLGSEIADSGLDVFYADDPDAKVNARMEVIGRDTITFMLDNPDPSRTLVIDPLLSSSFLGGSGTDQATGIATDSEGYVYVTGYTESPDFPTTPGAFETVYNGYTHDSFVTKLAPSGDQVVYSTFFGDEGSDKAQAIAVDADGCAYVTGYTSSNNFPTTPGALDRTYNGDTYDSFVTKFRPAGDSLAYSTFLGAGGVDTGHAIAVDAAGYAYVAGDTWSADFPVTPGAMTYLFNGGQNGAHDAFVAKLGQAGDSLVFSTFLGGNENDAARGIAVDGSGYVYVTGNTRSATFPTSANAFDRSHNGGIDAFVTKLTRTGGALAYSTFIGGSSSEYGNAIAVDRWGCAHVAGQTSSASFPVTQGAFDTTHNGWVDAFVVKVSKLGESLIYSTFLGGAEGEVCNALALDDAGRAHVAGYTVSPGFPVTPGAFDVTQNGNADAFVAKLGEYGDSLLYSTFLGGNGTDIATGLAISPAGYAYLTGETDSPDFPTVLGSADVTHNGGKDGFVTMLDLLEPVADAGPDQRIPEGTVAILDGSGSADNHGIANYTWSFHDGIGNRTLYGPNHTHLFAVPGVYGVALNVSDISANWDVATMNLTVLDITYPVAAAGPDLAVDEGATVAFNGTGSTDNVGIANYSWTFDCGQESIVLRGPAPVFVFGTPGVYVVTLNVSDAEGNWATDSMRVTVNDITPPEANAGPDAAVYKGTLFRFNGTASRDNVGIVNYTWTLSDGNGPVTLFGSSPSHFFDVEGVYPVTLRVSDAAGHWDTDTMELAVLETVPPVADAGPDLVADEGAVARFDGSASTDNVGVVRWEWSFPDGLNNVTLFGESPSWIFRVPGVYPVLLNASDAAGNWDTDEMFVTVLDRAPPVVVAGANRIVEPGTLVELDGSGARDSSVIADYTWSFTHNDTAVTLHGPSQSFRFWSPGTYTVTLTVRDAAGNAASDTLTVTVLPEAIEEPTGRATVWWAVPAAIAALLLLIALYVMLRRRGGGPDGQ